MGDLFLKGQRVIPRKLTEAGFIFRFPTFLEAVSNLVQ
jgi:NAD dependent epimerase/dehydratase family enzyme